MCRWHNTESTTVQSQQETINFKICMNMVCYLVMLPCQGHNPLGGLSSWILCNVYRENILSPVARLMSKGSNGDVVFTNILCTRNAFKNTCSCIEHQPRRKWSTLRPSSLQNVNTWQHSQQTMWYQNYRIRTQVTWCWVKFYLHIQFVLRSKHTPSRL